MQENFQNHSSLSQSENILLSQKNALLENKLIFEEKIKHELLKEQFKNKELEKELEKAIKKEKGE